MKFGIFLQHYFPYGGLQRDAVRLAEAAKLAGDHPLLIVSTWDGPKPEGIEVIELNSGGQANHAKAKNFAGACRATYAEHSLDSAICFSRVPGTPYHFCGDPCYKERFVREKHALNKFLPRYKYLLEVENALFGSKSSTHVFYLAASEIPAYQQFYTLPDTRYTLLAPWLRQPKKFTLDQTTLKHQYSQELGISAASKLLLFVGSDFQRKGLDRAIRALADLSNSDVHLVACGKYPASNYLALAEELSVTKQVHILGPRDDIPEWMAISDILIHPARQETAGMVLLEALTYTLPVLCTENCGYAAVVNEAGCPPLSEQATTEEISSRIQAILSAPRELRLSIKQWADQPSRYETASIMLDKMRNSFAP